MRKIKILVSVILSLTILIFTCVSCQRTNRPSDEDHLQFTDALGREVTVKKNPERVASLLGSFADI